MSDEGCELGADRTSGDSSTSQEALSEWIDKAAREVVRRAAHLNDGKQPRRVREWLHCCEVLGISVVPITHISSFTATISGFSHESWEILYNANMPTGKQARCIAHELSEYITREQSWSSPPPPCDVNGHAVRHQIARRVEAICFD